MPILGVVRAKDFDDAVEQAVWLEHGNRHSAHIHSKNVDRITKYAKAISQIVLLIAGVALLYFGAMRGEADLVLGKAIRLMDILSFEHFDLVILDLNLPDADGMAVLKTLRETDSETKVLILSARGEVADRVAGLDAGANDYLTKPFHLEELAARIRSLTRRQFTQNDVVLTCGDLTFESFLNTCGTAMRTASAIRFACICPRSERSCALRWGMTQSIIALARVT